MLQPLCGRQNRKYEIGTAKANAETYPEGFHADPIAETALAGCLVMPPRLVHAIKNGSRTLEAVAVAIESVIPLEVYRVILQAWNQGLKRALGFELAIVGYDHDTALLRRVMPALTRAFVLIFEIQLGAALGYLN